MGLKEYKSKRKFGKTPEPSSGLRRRGKQLIFVIHKHSARALHYDLRLELEGVLKSWAVPKGPSLDPSVKRLAMMVEDHPFDYRDFEGVIPKGNYGAGSVIIWDRGFYGHPSARNGKESENLLLEGLRKGNMKLVLEGKKLHGEFALVKAGRDDKSWLFLKKNDSYAGNVDVLKENRSVVSNKTLEEVSESGGGKPSTQKIDQIRLREAMEVEDLKRAPVGEMPHRVRPMLATLAREPFDDPDWIFEVKWDGYRAIAEVRDGAVSLYSRNLISLNKKFPPVADSLREFRFEAVFDGEIVVVDDQGRSDFQMLQNYQKSGGGHLLYYVFDLLYFHGHDLTGLPLVRRKELLRKIVPSGLRIRFSDHVPKDGVSFFKAVKEKGLEGMMAKHSQSVYRVGIRSRHWLKVKSRLTQDCVIAGFTKPKGSRRYFGSLILGAFKRKELIYVGHSGGGFTDQTLREIRYKLNPFIQRECPFGVVPESGTSVIWVKPLLVCEVMFHGWTDEGLMRQPVFLRLREDKSAREATREEQGEI